ncbi:aspartate--tRNA ligase [Maricaulis salignorans]|uniref:Aspartate--tRNA(Asp/Asn) ligase n=1 Tax=Maricaulis salignorans TaxID=144026 RepID=A0A1G9UKS5_9PROT|nr:aspartate--tRNA ligase [Maricaulis salignorans]SDM60463.1 aspartyl-tRNA synthetase [Maricaulis salignorans]
MHAYRSHTCGQLRPSEVGQTARISGWIHRKRDHGGLLFIDLRDHYGITQCVLEPESEHFERLERLRVESVVTITGDVVARDAEALNENLPTGGIEVRVRDLAVQSEAEELPLPVFGEPDWSEEVRLKHRYIDLRRESLHKRIVLRSKIIDSIRRRMVDEDFVEYQTPILTASSPEGARDFLVPSRLHPGKFYALPQAPQQFKQLIMVSGFDRYFQIAPCFRDEDARADRAPGEFYQLDMEMSFATQEDVFNVIEPVLKGLFDEFADGRTVPNTAFERVTYADSMAWYGSDKPDLRNPIKMSDVTETFRGSGFKVFAGMIEKNPKVAVWAIPAPTGGSRAFCDRMNSWAQKDGQPGMGYIFWRETDGVLEAAGPVAKNIGEERTEALRVSLDLKAGDAVFFAAGEPKAFASFAGRARDVVGKELDLCEKNVFKFCWIVDFPMYEWDEDNKKIDFSHNPFSMPQMSAEEFLAIEEGDDETLLGLKAFQYDIVCNGIELSSGAVRNHRPDVMLKAFAHAGYDAATVEEEFGGMLNAFRYGAPPHAGIAPGVDRIVMILAGVDNLREIVMFPKDQQARDLMMNAPAEVEMKQLRELHIRNVIPEAKKTS